MMVFVVIAIAMLLALLCVAVGDYRAYGREH